MNSTCLYETTNEIHKRKEKREKREKRERGDQLNYDINKIHPILHTWWYVVYFVFSSYITFVIINYIAYRVKMYRMIFISYSILSSNLRFRLNFKLNSKFQISNSKFQNIILKMSFQNHLSSCSSPTFFDFRLVWCFFLYYSKQ